MSADRQPRVAIIMGSQSDAETMKNASDILDQLGIPSETRVMSAHRTPQRVLDYLATAEERGIDAIIAGAGLAAHLAGVVASHTLIPVIGVPMEGGPLKGMDALLATVQMPGGIPVGTMAIGKPGAKNAALLVAAFFARTDPEIKKALAEFRQAQTDAVPEIP